MNRIIAIVAAVAVVGAAFPASPRPFTQRDLVALDRIADPRISPDGQWVIYDLATLNADGARRTHTIMKLSTSGTGAPVKLATGSNARWAPDGEHILFIAPAGATDQVWSVSVAHPQRAPVQVTALPSDVQSFRLSPDGRTLVVAMAVVPGRETIAEIRQSRAAGTDSSGSGRLYDQLFARHWDSWNDGRRNHLFALGLGSDGKAGDGLVALTPGFDGDIPDRPFGDDGDYAIAPDSRSVIFSSRIAGRNEAWSINYDLWSVPLTGAAPPRNLTTGNPAWDATPVFSPDGRSIAYRATRRPGFEADRFAIMLASAEADARREVAPAWDRSADKVVFSSDAKTLYVTAGDVQNQRLFRLDIATGAATPLSGRGHIGGFDLARTPDGDVLVFTRDTMAGPPQIYVLRPGSGPVQLTRVGEARLRDVEMSPYRSFSFTGWNDEIVHGWIVKPHDWQPGMKYPTVFLVHGGPQGSWTDSWSTRWNPQVFAGWGYGVVMVDFHGSTGYGQAFTDAISGHWGDRPLEDLQKGWAAVRKQAPWIDAARACQGGNSYGGFMTYWIAGVWNEPWKCQISHDGIFDVRMGGYETDELWPYEWDLGPSGTNTPASYTRFNPIDHVAAWTKPMLIIHSEKDYRVPLDQGFAAFTALQRKGIDSQFLTFPDESHYVVKPANSLMWHDVIEAWLKRWIGRSPTPDSTRPPRPRPNPID